MSSQQQLLILASFIVDQGTEEHSITRREFLVIVNQHVRLHCLRNTQVYEPQKTQGPVDALQSIDTVNSVYLDTRSTQSGLLNSLCFFNNVCVLNLNAYRLNQRIVVHCFYIAGVVLHLRCHRYLSEVIVNSKFHLQVLLFIFTKKLRKIFSSEIYG